jgi:hypothetical protein
LDGIPPSAKPTRTGASESSPDPEGSFRVALFTFGIPPSPRAPRLEPEGWPGVAGVQPRPGRRARAAAGSQAGGEPGRPSERADPSRAGPRAGSDRPVQEAGPNSPPPLEAGTCGRRRSPSATGAGDGRSRGAGRRARTPSASGRETRTSRRAGGFAVAGRGEGLGIPRDWAGRSAGRPERPGQPGGLGSGTVRGVPNGTERWTARTAAVRRTRLGLGKRGREQAPAAVRVGPRPPWPARCDEASSAYNVRTWWAGFSGVTRAE